MTCGFGKIILLGEHAVVYGHPALAGGLSRRVDIAVSPGSGPTALEIPDWELAVTVEDDHPVATALGALVDGLGADRRGLLLRGHADLPDRAGLGSSAALSVAITRALADHLGLELDPDRLAALADVGERCFHNTPSGIDVAMASRGGWGLFRRQAGLTPIDAAPLQLLVGLSDEPRRTADMVARVAAARERDPAITGRWLDALGAGATAGANALATGDLAQLGRLMSAAHEALSALEVSTPTLDNMVAAAQRAGAMGAKLTGGGGGGAVIALAPERQDEVLATWKALGFRSLTCTVGERTARAR